MRSSLEGKSLRKKAEKILPQKRKAPQKIPSADMERLIHELEVHQVELEMQNQELRKAQEKIEKSRSQYVDLYELAPVGYFTLNKKGMIREVNLAGADLLGIKRRLFLELHFSLFIMPEDRDLYQNFHGKVLRIPGRQSCELRLKRRKSDPLWVRLEGVAIEEPDSKLPGVRLALIDISDRKRAEEEVLRLNAGLEAKVTERTAQLEAANKALKDQIARQEQAEEEIRRSEREFRGIFELSSVGMVERDASTGKKVHVNQRLCEITGYSAGELLSGEQVKLTYPDDWQRDQEVRVSVLKGESETWVIEKRLLRKNGEVIWVLVNGNLIRDSSGRPLRTVAVIQDITERKRTEMELHESQALLQAVMTTTSDPIYVKDRQSRILMCNPALGKVAGKPASEIIGKTDSEYYDDPVIGQALRENDLRVMESGCSQTTEEIVKTPDGSRTFISNKAPFRNQSGDISGIIGISHDITERKRAEEALRESEAKTNALIRYAPTAVYELNYEGTRFISVNDAMCRILSYTREELLAMNPSALLDENSRSLFDDRVRRQLTGQKIEDKVEYRVRKKDGSFIDAILYVSISPGGGKPGHTMVIAHDITERKQAEKKLNDSERLYRAIGESIDYGIWVCDPEGRNIYASESFLNLVGITQDQCSQFGWGDVLHPEDAEGTIAAWKECVRTGGKWDIEHRYRGVDGKWHPILARGVPVRDEQGKVICWAGINLDISGLKQMEEDLRRSRDELEKRVQERTEELGKSHSRLQNLSSQLLLAQEKERKRVAVELHDGLLSELAGVKYMLEARTMLLEQGKTPEVSDLKRVSSILAIAIKEARGIMNNLHPSVLDELGLLAALNWLSGEYQKSYPHIKVQEKMEIREKDVAESLKVVIYRILQEALNNFAKHGKGDLVDLSLAKSDRSLVLLISDNGQGFDIQEVQKGLGLESMRERVELSGGEFKIESRIGRGTTIRAIWST